MKMKSYPTFDAYFANQPPENQAVIRKIRAFVKRIAPKLQESVKWGNGCWLKDDAPVAYVYAAPDHTQFGFFAGSVLRDPKKLLQGTGKCVRHIKLQKASDIKDSAFASLLRQAMRTGHPALSKIKPDSARTKTPRSSPNT